MKKYTPTFAVALLCVSAIFGQDQKPAHAKDAPKVEAPAFPKALDELTVLKLENLQLKATKAQSDIEAANKLVDTSKEAISNWSKEYAIIIAGKCKDNGLSPAECIVGKDGNGNWMVGKADPPKKEAKE